jgi:hypothetical protein
MNKSRRTYAIAVGAASLALVGSMVGAGAYAASGATRSGGEDSWASGLSAEGMMGDGWDEMADHHSADGDGTAHITLDEATASAQDWASIHQPGASIESGLAMPMGFLFIVRVDGRVVAHVMVDDDTGEAYGSSGVGDSGGMMGFGWGESGGSMMGDTWSSGRSWGMGS